MTSITLPDDLNARLAEEASKKGTTAELLAVDTLRTVFPPLPTASSLNGAKRGSPVKSLIGLAAGSGPPPTDDDVDRWLAERRLEKYGK